MAIVRQNYEILALVHRLMPRHPAPEQHRQASLEKSLQLRKKKAVLLEGNARLEHCSPSSARDIGYGRSWVDCGTGGYLANHHNIFGSCSRAARQAGS